MPSASDVVRALRATRTFTSDSVDAELVEAIVDVARWTGSARNRQPWRLVVTREAVRRAELARLGGYASFLAGAPVVLLLGVDHTLRADAEFDAGRFAQSLMIAAHEQGLGTCPVTFFPEDNVARATRLAGLEAPWRVRTGVALGWPRAGRGRGGRSTVPSSRRATAEILSDREAGRGREPDLA